MFFRCSSDFGGAHTEWRKASICLLNRGHTVHSGTRPFPILSPFFIAIRYLEPTLLADRKLPFLVVDVNFNVRRQTLRILPRISAYLDLYLNGVFRVEWSRLFLQKHHLFAVPQIFVECNPSFCSIPLPTHLTFRQKHHLTSTIS